MTELTPAQKDFCLYTGLFGIMIGAVCFIQHFFVWETSIFSLLLELTSIAGIIACTFLALQKKESGVLLIISASLLLLRLFIFVWLTLMHIGVVFNLVQILYFIYILIITIIYFVGGYPALLKKIHAEKKHDEAFWNNKFN